jgi:hypothetical protein
LGVRYPTISNRPLCLIHFHLPKSSSISHNCPRMGIARVRPVVPKVLGM